MFIFWGWMNLKLRDERNVYGKRAKLHHHCGRDDTWNPSLSSRIITLERICCIIAQWHSPRIKFLFIASPVSSDYLAELRSHVITWMIHESFDTFFLEPFFTYCSMNLRSFSLLLVAFKERKVFKERRKTSFSANEKCETCGASFILLRVKLVLVA